MRERGDFEKGITFGNGGDRVLVKFHQQKKMWNTFGVDLVWGLVTKYNPHLLLEKYNNIQYESRYKKFSRRNTKRFRVVTRKTYWDRIDTLIKSIMMV